MRPPGYGYDREILVGLFVMLGIFVIGLFSMKITDSPIIRSGTEYSVVLPDANGIFKNSKVKIAGISVGVVKDIKLIDGQAHMVVLLDKGQKLERGSHIAPRSQGILGDRFLEIVLPKKDEEIKEGAPIQGAGEESTSSSSYFYKFLENLLPTAAAQEIIREGENIPTKPGSSTPDDVMKKLGEIGDDVKILARDLKDIVRNNKGDIESAIKAIRRSADNLDLILRDLSTKETRQDLKESIRGIRQAVDNIKLIAERINNGEGTIGKLINDPQAADQLVRALNSIVEFLDRARRTQLIVDMNTNILMGGDNKSKTYFNIKIMPRSSYGYLVGAVQDPGGREIKTTTYTSSGGGPEVETKERKFEKAAFKVNVQFMRKIFRTNIRLGLFEHTGGFGIDQEIWKDHFFITAEAFDFGRENENAHVRAYAKLQFLETFYIQGGYDDVAAKSGTTRKDSLFVGLGLTFNDNDLKNFFVFFSGM